MKATLSSRSIAQTPPRSPVRSLSENTEKIARPEPVGFELVCARVVGVLILMGLFAFIIGAIR